MRASLGFPQIAVLLQYLSPEITLSDALAGTATDLSQSLDNFKVISQGEVEFVPGVPAYELIYTWTEAGSTGNIDGKASTLFIGRGSQAFILWSIAPLSTFDANKDTISKVVHSLRFQESAPFGVPRSQALTLLDSGPVTLDPALSRDAASHAYIFQIFSGLVTYDKDMKLVPDIAERWTVSEDGRTYTFYLTRPTSSVRPAATFHDGRLVTAGDFKYSWERACNPETGSQTAADFLGDIVGVSDVIAGRATEISGVEVVDDYTLRVTTDAPKVYFLDKLTYSVAFVVDRENVESGEEWWRQPNGTGPFKLKEWQQDQLLILERNDSFYRYQERPKVSYVVFRLWGGVAMWMYNDGEIDVAGISLADVEQVMDETSPLHNELVVFPDLSVDFIGFNPTKEPFNDPDIRRAFAMAVNREQIIETVLKGMVDPASGVLPPSLPAYNPDLEGISYNPEEARAIIVAKYGDVSKLPPITLTTAGYGTDPSPVTVALIQQWQENLGVQVQVRQLEPEKWAYLIKEEKDEILEFGWMGDYPDPHAFLDLLFHTGSQANDLEYSNAEFDSLLEQARTEVDAGRRVELYRQAEQLLVEDAAIIPLWFGKSYSLVKPYVKDFVLSPQGVPYLNLVSLEAH